MQDLFVVIHPDRQYRQQLGADREIEQTLARHPTWPIWWEVSTPDPDWDWICRPRPNPTFRSDQRAWGTLAPPIRAWCMGWHANHCVVNWIRDCMAGQGESRIIARATVALDPRGLPTATAPLDYPHSELVRHYLAEPGRP